VFFSELVVAGVRYWFDIECTEWRIVKGFIDNLNQAILPLDLYAGELEFVIDTGFSGEIILGQHFFDVTKDQSSGRTHAILTGGSSEFFDTCKIEIASFDRTRSVTVIISPGDDCLIGTDLLNPHLLEVDYARRTVHLHESSI